MSARKDRLAPGNQVGRGFRPDREGAQSTLSALSKDGGRQPTGKANQAASWPRGARKRTPEKRRGRLLRMRAAPGRVHVAAELWVVRERAAKNEAVRVDLHSVCIERCFYSLVNFPSRAL